MNLESVTDWKAKACELARLLIVCRDALPAISTASARLHGVPLDLDKQIEAALEPWRIDNEDEAAKWQREGGKVV